MFQLASAVADTTNEEIVIEADVMFPSQSPITIDPGRSVSIVGRSGDGGGRVKLDGLGDSRFFVVDGGLLYLTHLNLVNGSAPESESTTCDLSTRDVLWCGVGGAIVIFEDGQLIVSSCDIRGQGRRNNNNYAGGGVHVFAYHTVISFFNTTFEDLSSQGGGAFNIFNTLDDGEPACIATFRHCRFVNIYSGVATIALDYKSGSPLYFYDCQFFNNQGMVILNSAVASSMTLHRCTFRDNSVGTVLDDRAQGSVIESFVAAAYDIRDCVFENNIGLVGGKGGALCFRDSATAIVVNCTFIENQGDTGAVLAALSGASVTMIGCYARGNSAFGIFGGAMVVDAATLFMVNSTFTKSYGFFAAVAFLADGAVVNIEHSIFTDSRAVYMSGFHATGASSLSMTDCIHHGAEATAICGYAWAEGSSTLVALRNSFRDITSNGIGACSYTRGSVSVFEDCEFVGCDAGTGDGGGFFLRAGADVLVVNSRIVGSAAGNEGRVAWLDAGSSMRIVGTTVMNTSGEAAFAIHTHDEPGTDFALQFDTVTVDNTVNIFSNGSDVLLQNCDGFAPAAVKKADIATCASTSDFCIPESCMDATAGIDQAVGIECTCFVDGVATVLNC